MKRHTAVLIALALVLVLGLCACGEEGQSDTSPSADGAYYKTALAAVEGFNGEERRSTAVIISLTEGGESLYFAQGSFSYDRGTPLVMSGRNTQVFGGEGTTDDVYYKAGAYYYSGKGGKFYEAFDRELFLNQYICTNLGLCGEDTVSSCRSAETSAGTKYVFDSNDVSVLHPLFSETLSVYSGLRRAQTEKTAYSGGSFTCVVDSAGKLQSFKISCTVTMYDTAPYYPTGYTPSEEELKHSFELSYEVSVKGMGSEVEIDTPDTKEYTFLG